MTSRSRKRVVAIALAGIAALAGIQLALFGVYRAIERGRGAAGPAAKIEGAPLAGAQPAPAFAATRRDGSAAAIAWPAPRARLVHFWGTWCEPCRRELPSLLAFARARPALEVIAVAVDDDWPSIDAFFDGTVPPQVVIAIDAGVAQRYGASLLPDSYLVDGAGVLVERFLGAHDWASAALRERLDRLTR